ncbi:MAG: FtsX-like permease family protein [Segetibacter sp.]|nr:FtsX-like permease family protein [Segetibacter sp.]
MIKNYFKTAWRNLIKDKQFSLLNLVGLSTGLACALLIYLWVSDELSIDKFNINDSRLYQVLKMSTDGNGAIDVGENTQGLLAQSIAKELPEAEFTTCVKKESDPGILSFGDKHIKAKPAFAENNFFNVFSYHLMSGDKDKALSDISGVLVSDETALKLFNTTNVVGKMVNWDLKYNKVDFSNVYKVSGVFKAPPSDATDQFDVLFPFDLYAQKNAGRMGDVTFWGSNMVSTYVVLKAGTNVDAFNNKIKDFAKTKIKSLYAGNDMIKYEGDLFIQKYSDRYLHNNFVNGVLSGGRIEYVKLFSIIAIFILIIACINFMNLSTAKASRRMKEVGIKKVVGASRSSLIFQYISESMLMAFASLLIALLAVVLLLPAFKQITGKEISLQLNARLIVSIISITFVTGLIAGSYPALYLSGFKPILILKGKLNTSMGESWIRKGLVVFQFSISVMLIVSVLVVYQQMKLIQTTNLGYNKDNIIRFSNDGNLANNFSSFITALKNIPGVINAAGVDGDLMGNYSHAGGGISWEGKDPNLGIEYYGNSIDNDFFETMNLQVAEGRAFSKSFADSSGVIFNQSAIKAMGLKNPVGKTVSLWGEKKQIIGVVKDYHFESLYKKIGPAFFTFSHTNPTTVVKIKAGTEQQTIARIKELYNKYNNGLDFSYAFLDDDYNTLYASEQRVALLSRYFAGIAILISCLGLFGLAAFTAQRRQKEIGIRKVIGASVSDVVTMLSKDFLVLVCIALLIAIPISWWSANEWLQSFAYRISISPLVFVITSVSIMLITLLTISFQSIKAALANPVKSLRTE